MPLFSPTMSNTQVAKAAFEAIKSRQWWVIVVLDPTTLDGILKYYEGEHTRDYLTYVPVMVLVKGLPMVAAVVFANKEKMGVMQLAEVVKPHLHDDSPLEVTEEALKRSYVIDLMGIDNKGEPVGLGILHKWLSPIVTQTDIEQLKSVMERENGPIE